MQTQTQTTSPHRSLAPTASRVDGARHLGGSDRAPRGVIPDGDAVEVRNRFENHWVHGFAVATSGDAGYRLRRLSDGRVLPAWFPHDVVRRRA